MIRRPIVKSLTESGYRSWVQLAPERYNTGCSRAFVPGFVTAFRVGAMIINLKFNHGAVVTLEITYHRKLKSMLGTRRQTLLYKKQEGGGRRDSAEMRFNRTDSCVRMLDSLYYQKKKGITKGVFDPITFHIL